MRKVEKVLQVIYKEFRNSIKVNKSIAFKVYPRTNGDLTLGIKIPGRELPILFEKGDYNKSSKKMSKELIKIIKKEIQKEINND
jgi:hypothetical protein